MSVPRLSILFGATILLLALILILILAWQDRAASPSTTAPAAGTVDVVAPIPGAPGGVAPVTRAPPPAPEPPAPTPAPLAGAKEAEARWLELLVVDVDAQPVPGAHVEVWDTLSLPEPEGPAALALENIRAGRAQDWDHGVYNRWRQTRNAAMQRSARNPADHELTTDADGRVRIELAGPETFLYVTDGNASSRLWTAADAWNDGLGTQRVVLHARATVRGRVIGADDRPVGGASVRIENRLELQPPPRWPEALVVDADGRFELLLDTPSFLEFVAESAGRDTLPEQVSLQPGESRQIVLEFVAGPYAVTGLVVGADGEPVVGASVLVQGGHFQISSPLAGTTARDGVFSIAVPGPAHYRPKVTAADWIQGLPAEVELTEEQPVRHVVIPMLEPVTITGVVRTSSGTPVPDVLVFGTPADIRTSTMVAEPARTDANGAFTLTRVHPLADYTVKTSTDRRQAWAHDVAPGTEDLVLVLSDRADLTDVLLRAVDDQTGEPVTAFETTLRASDPSLGPASFLPSMFREGDEWHDSPEGAARLHRLDPVREYVVRVRAPGFAEAYVGPFRPGESTEPLVARLRRSGTLRVLVRAASGRPRVSIAVDRLGPMTDIIGRVLPSQGVTGEDGAVSWRGLVPGDYVVQTNDHRVRREQARVTITSGETTSVTLTVRPVD